MPPDQCGARWAALVLWFAFGLIGCGGSNEQPSSQTDASRQDSAVVAPPTSTAAVNATAQPEQSAAAATDSSAGPMPLTVPDKDGSVVKVHVYYGTDRAARQVPITWLFPPAAWFYLTIISATLTMLLAAWGHCRPGRRWLAGMSACGLALTVVAGVVGSQIRVQRLAGDGPTKRIYAAQRGTLELGICEVNVPAQHEANELEGASILHLAVQHDPLKNVVLLDTQQQTPEEFYADMRNCVDHSGRKEALVFVHGYNVTFSDAARRTAQLAYDLQFDGAPIFFSWPSQGSLLDYLVDETNVAWSVPHLKELLVDVAKQSGAQSVHLVAHSMGNRALTSALKELHYEMGLDCPKFDTVVLTAPDVDAETFKQDLAPAIVKTAQRMTLYASSNDEALLVSKKVHGYARAGESGDQLVVVPGIDTIDVSAVDTSLLGHSYYGDNYTVLADLFDLFNNGRPPAERHWLRSAQLGQWVYWIFLRDAARLEAALPKPDPIRK